MLAARVDACHESTDGHIGQTLRDEIEKKLDKLQEPPPVKFIKPLPKPIDPGRKKRGGKRVRKMKERYAITEFRKHANRMNFADVRKISLIILFTLKFLRTLCLPRLLSTFRLRTTLTKKTWATLEELSARREQAESDYLRSTRRPKFVYRKRFKRIYRSNSNGAAVRRSKNKSLVPLPASRSRRYR